MTDSDFVGESELHGRLPPPETAAGSAHDLITGNPASGIDEGAR